MGIRQSLENEHLTPRSQEGETQKEFEREAMNRNLGRLPGDLWRRNWIGGGELGGVGGEMRHCKGRGAGCARLAFSGGGRVRWAGQGW